MGDMMAVNFAEIQQAASTITTQSKSVDELLDQLRGEVTKTLAGYTGAAAEAYQEQQTKWDTAAADLNAVLAAIGTAVQTAGESYQQAENQNKGRW